MTDVPPAGWSRSAMSGWKCFWPPSPTARARSSWPAGRKPRQSGRPSNGRCRWPAPSCRGSACRKTSSGLPGRCQRRRGRAPLRRTAPLSLLPGTAFPARRTNGRSSAWPSSTSMINPVQSSPGSLPAGSPFGAVAVDPAACTLCMACAVACPSGALSAGGDVPRL